MSSPTYTSPQTLILMGVCGCGKTAVGTLLAQRLGGSFEDGDDFHSDEAREKMRSGQPLTDDDRRPWYARLRARVEAVRATGQPYVLACSALKRDYRAWLRVGDGPESMRFAHLDGSFELIESRLAARKGHFMPPTLLASQFATLELGDDITPVDIDQSVEGIVEDILSRIYTKAIA